MTAQKPRIIAFYLPQFHPIPENDAWWGKGFTEWTNVGKAKPLFRGHYQPRVPADLGYYDLRLPESRAAQAAMAKAYGVEGFCYWHYWFGNGKRLLERPFHEVLESGEPDFPFCLGWANHSWEDKQFKKGGTNKLLIKQEYPGDEDYRQHFLYVLKAFRDSRYLRVDDKPIFFVHGTKDFDVAYFIRFWQQLALEHGLKGIHFVAN
jgi:lipopolysaccharide biosynthesis protein